MKKRMRKEDEKAVWQLYTSEHFHASFSLKRAVSAVFSKNREEKDKKKRGKRRRKYNCMTAVYAGLPNYSLSFIFSWQNAANAVYSRDEER